MIESSLTQSDPVTLPDRSLGRVVRSVIGHSLLTALMIVSTIFIFVPAMLFHCAIRNGRRAAWLTLLLSMAMAALYFVAVPVSSATEMKMVWSYVAAMLFAIGLPSMIVLPMVERGETFARVLVFLLVFSAIGLAVTEFGSREVLSFSPFATELQQLQQMNGQLTELLRPKMAPAEAASLQRWMGYTAIVAPAFILMNMGVVFVLSLLMLGRLKAWRDWTARRGDTETAGAYLFRTFALPEWMLFVFILGGLTPLASGMLQKVAANMLAVVAFLYILQGLAVLRFVLISIGAGLGMSLLTLALLGLLTVVGGVAPLLLAVTGLFDPFFDFRHFKNRKDDSDESHSD